LQLEREQKDLSEGRAAQTPRGPDLGARPAEALFIS